MSNDPEARGEIRTHCRRAVDALGGGEFRHAAELLAPAVAVAERLGDPALLARTGYLLAFARRQFGDLQRSLEGSARLMALASNPLHRTRLGDDETALAALADAFALHLDAGRVAGMSVGGLRAVLDGGRAFLRSIGRPAWAHRLHLPCGLLRLLEGRMRSALWHMLRALQQRHRAGAGPIGFALCRHLVELADVLAALGRFRTARQLCLRVYREHPTGFCRPMRQRACVTLSRVAEVEGDPRVAERWARRAAAMAREDDAAEFRVPSLASLVRVLLARGRIAAATHSTEALRLVGDPSPPSAQFTAAVTLCAVALARRELAAASVWHRRATDLGCRLNLQSGRDVSSLQIEHLHRRLAELKSANGMP